MIRAHNFARRFQEIKQEYYDSLEFIHNQECVVNGHYTNQVEKKIQNLTGKKHALLMRSGAQSLRWALLASGIQSGDEVIISNYSCPASLACVTLLNAIPVLCEIDEYGQMDSSYLEELVSEKTRAIIATGLYGDSHDHKNIKNFCTRNNLLYINDCAQSYFSKFDGVECATLGDVVCMSFADNKQIPIPGTHGALATDSDSVYYSVLNARRSGKAFRKSPIVGIGETGRPDEDKAAQILISWNHSGKWQSRRQQIGKYYQEYFTTKNIPYRGSPNYSTWNTHKFAILCDDKFEMQSKLLTHDIESEAHYPDNFTLVSYLNKPYKQMQWTDYFCKKSLSIPINAHMTDSEVEYVAETVWKNF